MLDFRQNLPFSEFIDTKHSADTGRSV